MTIELFDKPLPLNLLLLLLLLLRISQSHHLRGHGPVEQTPNQLVQSSLQRSCSSAQGAQRLEPSWSLTCPLVSSSLALGGSGRPQQQWCRLSRFSWACHPAERCCTLSWRSLRHFFGQIRLLPFPVQRTKKSLSFRGLYVTSS